MHIDRKDIGYTIMSRLESSLRIWISSKLYDSFGDKWQEKIPYPVLYN